MNSCKPRIIHERSKIIPISQTLPTIKKDGFSVNEYGLKHNFFDPLKSSPPNDFMLKLRLRIYYYNSLNNLESLINE